MGCLKWWSFLYFRDLNVWFGRNWILVTLRSQWVDVLVSYDRTSGNSLTFSPGARSIPLDNTIVLSFCNVGNINNNNNINEKIKRIWLAENDCIFYVLQVQSCRVQITNSARVSPKFRPFWLSVKLFSCKLLTSNNMISCAIWWK